MTSILRCAAIVAALLVPTASHAGAAQRAPITHETLWMMKRVGAPVVSPDGRMVAFSVVSPSYDPDKQSSDIFVVPSDGSAPPRQITFTRASKSGLSWSPDKQAAGLLDKA